jgi:uncharacterized membrane protein YfcA
MLPLTIALVLAVLFLAGMAKATLGFGESLIAMPLLTLLVGVQMAAPLAALMMTTLTGFLLLQTWQRVDFHATWRVMLAAVIGIPFGVWGLRALPAHAITLALGVILVLVGLFYLGRPTVRWIPGPRWGYLFGLIAGLMGGLVTAGGPPIVIFGTLRRLPPEEFRATLQGCFTPLNIFILLGHALAGLWTQPVLELYAMSLPVIFLALWIGGKLHHAIPAQTFSRVVYLVLVALGVVMVIS